MSKKQYNVNREVNDTFYRYKMPAIIAKVEGQGNGIKTVIDNMVAIARALNREAIYPTKYFGIELGAQTQIDKKNERYIVNGSHDSDKLQDILDGYIKKFVLCQQCENPETRLNVQREDIYETCMACGNKGKLRNMGHGLANFIVRQHKNSKIDNKRKKDREGKTTKTTKNIYEGEGVAPAEGASEPATAAKVNGREKKDDWEGDDWAESDSEDENMEKLKNLSLREMKPGDMTGEQRGQAFEEYFQELIDEGQIEGMMKAKEKIMQIVLKADYYGIKAKAPFVMFEKLFTTEEFLKIAKKYRGLLIYINRNTDDSPDLKAMKYSLHAFETYIERFPALTDKTPVLLKFLYDVDIIDEAAIIEWGDAKPSKKYISKELSGTLKEKCRKVVEWLKTAETESEESEDDSDDDDGAMEFTENKPAGIVTVAPPKPVAPTNGDANDDDEESDIDDI